MTITKTVTTAQELTLRRIGTGAGPNGQNVMIVPFEERPDFNPANMRPDDVVNVVEAVFSIAFGSWDVSNNRYSIDAESRLAYLKPFNDPEFYPGGGDHHIHAKATNSAGRPLYGAGIAFTSDGVRFLQPPQDPEKVVGRNTEGPHGWCNLPIYAGSFPPDIPGPWSVTKQGMSDGVTGIGMPFGEHHSIGVVFREVRWADWQNTAPDFDTFDEALLWHAERKQVIQFNPDAALQNRIFAAGFVPNSPEFYVIYGGISYVAQRAEHLGIGEVRIYYAPITDYNNVSFKIR